MKYCLSCEFPLPESWYSDYCVPCQRGILNVDIHDPSIRPIVF